MRLVYLCDEYPPAASGGIGTFTRGIAQAMMQAGHEVHVVGHYAQSAATREVDAGVEVWRLPAPSGRLAPLRRRMTMWRALREIAASGAVDILEAPDFEGNSAFLPRCSRVRLVRLHGSHLYFSDERGVAPSRSVSFLERAALKQADSIVSVSYYTARCTRDLFRLSTSISTIHNAVNVNASVPRKQDYAACKRVVYFGTLAEKKGVLTLADAWRQFSPTHPDWRLELIGRDSQFSGGSVQDEALRRLGAAATTTDFVGPLAHDEVLRRLPNYDFAVLPSYSEAFALAPMEAMGLGVPVVGSSMSSGPELIEHGVDGWLCDPRQVESVLAMLELAAANADERARIGQAARRKVEKVFAYDAFVQRNIEFYEALLRRRSVA